MKKAVFSYNQKIKFPSKSCESIEPSQKHIQYKVVCQKQSIPTATTIKQVWHNQCAKVRCSVIMFHGISTVILQEFEAKKLVGFVEKSKRNDLSASAQNK